MIVRRARVRLTLLFVAMFSIVLVVFSVVFYAAFAVVLLPDFDMVPEVTTGQAAQAAYNTAIDRIGASLVVADAIAVVVVGLVAWVLARRTLEPVLEAHLRQQRFVADASHETRNPLAAIKATTGAALDGDRTPDELRAALVTVDASVDRLTRLTSDLLLLARSNDPLTPLRREASDLSVIASEALASVAGPATSTAAIETDLEPDLPVMVDPDEIGRIVRNLLENAVHHGGEGVHITIRTWRGDGEAHLEVRDDGPGIAEAEIDRIFDPFYRPQHRQREWDGAGLGLSIAQDLARRNDGRLSVVSNPGAGASFRLTLARLK